MQEKQAKEEPLQSITSEQTTDVAGGDGTCTTTVSANLGPVGVVETSPDVASGLIGMYEGVVDATSYVIERVANSVK